MRSVNGAAATTVRRDTAAKSPVRLFYLSNTNAVVDGFTLTDATMGAVRIDCGTVANCSIDDNYGEYVAAGVSLNGAGCVTKCRIINNYVRTTGGGGWNGGGVAMTGSGAVDSCIISNNIVTYGSGGYGGGVYMSGSGAKLMNCLVVNNTHSGYAGGVYCENGTIESCTISSNVCSRGDYLAGLYCSGSAVVRDTIVYDNFTPSGILSNVVNSGTSYSYQYCDVNPLQSGSNSAHNICADPLFRNPAAGDFRLLAGSPCVGAGTNTLWMTNGTDVAGNRRIIGRTVDIGCFESTQNAATVIFMR